MFCLSIEYYNNFRPHQGIDSIPRGVPPNKEVCGHELNGTANSRSVPDGLIKHYFYKEVA